jgi:hypothetical protein
MITQTTANIQTIIIFTHHEKVFFIFSSFFEANYWLETKKQFHHEMRDPFLPRLTTTVRRYLFCSCDVEFSAPIPYCDIAT